MLSEWVRYLKAIQNTRGITPLYSVANQPMTLVPVVAYVARSGRIGAAIHAGQGG